LKAEIAKELVSAEPKLSHPEMRDVLMAGVEERYTSEHVVIVQLGEKDCTAIEDPFESTAISATYRLVDRP
jgi:hypothetical protein